jgi:hypothetical protein
MKHILLLLVIVPMAVSLQGQTSKELLYINSEKGDCQSTMSMKCLQIKNTGSGTGKISLMKLKAFLTGKVMSIPWK